MNDFAPYEGQNNVEDFMNEMAFFSLLLINQQFTNFLIIGDFIANISGMGLVFDHLTPPQPSVDYSY